MSTSPPAVPSSGSGTCMINDIKTDCGPATGISIEENMYTYPFAPSHPMSFKPAVMWLPLKRHRYSRIQSADMWTERRDEARTCTSAYRCQRRNGFRDLERRTGAGSWSWRTIPACAHGPSAILIREPNCGRS